MISKIISGGQTGADRAALDVAIVLGIPHGGWVPRGRMTESGRLPDNYVMQETTSISYPERSEMNVADSDGTLVVSHGKLAGGSALTLDLAAKHRKPCLHIDLNELDALEAAKIVSSWIGARQIKILNVAGPRASEDPEIYEATRRLLTLVIQDFFPKTVDEAVETLLAEMTLKDKAGIAKTEEQALPGLQVSFGYDMRRRFGLGAGNSALLESCAQALGKDKIREAQAPAVIIKELWKKLRETHSLRSVK
jgi:Circularly permutated YpsA SLOG family